MFKDLYRISDSESLVKDGMAITLNDIGQSIAVPVNDPDQPRRKIGFTKIQEK